VHVVVMGCGRVGSAIARRLEEIGHSVAVIDQDPEAFRRLGPDFAGRQVTGLGFDRQTLLDAGADAARRGNRFRGRVRRGEQRRQLQHHQRAGGP